METYGGFIHEARRRVYGNYREERNYCKLSFEHQLCV